MSKCFVIISYLDRPINLACMGLTALACFNNKGKMIKDVLIGITIMLNTNVAMLLLIDHVLLTSSLEI